MTQDQYSQVLTALTENQIHNTTTGFAISITRFEWCDIDDYTVTVFSSLTTRTFVSSTLNYLLQVAGVFGLFLSVDSKHGVPVVRLR